MHFIRWAAVAATSAMLVAGSAFAADRATPDEAKALVEKGAAHLKEVGLDKALIDFADPQGGYMDRDLFIFLYAPDGKILSGSGNPGLIGRNALALKDIDGKEFGKDIMAAAAAGGGWAEYRMSNPLTKKAEPKKTYAVKVGDNVVAAGAYIP